MNKIILFILLSLIFTSCTPERLETEEVQNNIQLARSSSLRNSNNEISVATYNLHLFLGPAPLEDDIRQKKITEFIINNLSNNDVLYLSEVWKDKTKNEIAEDLKNIYPFSIHSNAVNFNQGDGLLILSKFPIQENKFILFNNSAGLDSFAPKGFHKTRFSTLNGDFYSFFTHTQADSDKRTTRKKQLEQIKEQMNDLGGIPSIITGDLNVIGDVIGEYDDLKMIFNNYKDSYRELNNNSKGFTYDNVNNKLANYFYSVASNGASQERLDYILVSEGWTLISSDLIDNCNYQSPKLNEIVSCSDHFGIKTTLILDRNIQRPNPNILDTYDQAKDRINSLKSEYGTGNSAKIIIHNNTNKEIVFKNSTSWYNSSFYNSPPSLIPVGKYGVILATHDTGEATGTFNQLSYWIDNKVISFGTYVPWSQVRTNNILVNFNQITKDQLEKNSTRPSIIKLQENIKLTGKISKGDSPFVEFFVENH